MNLPDDIFGEIGIHLSREEFQAIVPLMTNPKVPDEYRCSKQEEILSKKYGFNLRDLIHTIEENRKFIDAIIDKVLDKNEQVENDVREYFYRCYQLDRNKNIVEYFVNGTLHEAIFMASLETENKIIVVTLDDVEYAMKHNSFYE